MEPAGRLGRPEIWRLALRSGRPDMKGRHTEQVEYCLRRKIAALGWGAPNNGTADDALKQIGSKNWKNGQNTVRRFINAENGALVWALHTDGTYLLGELVGLWRYDDSAEAASLDSYQVRDVIWSPRLDAAEVPGAVIRAYSGQASAFQRISDDVARRCSHQIFARLNGRSFETVDNTPEEVLSSLLDPWDVEDLVALYLQVTRGLLVVPSTRQNGTAGYEYVLIDPTSGEHVVVQVKTGGTPVDLRRLMSAEGEGRKALAFSTEDKYTGDGPNVEKLERREIIEFMVGHTKLIPRKITQWLEH